MAQTYNILMNRFNGTDHDPLLPKNHLNGTSDPTTSTVGIVGQFYLNITTKRLWQCTNVNGSVYTWCVLNSNKNLLDNAWFASPHLVNQRGQSSYATSGNYSVDRFTMSGVGSVAIGSNGLTITRSGDYVVLMQRIELARWNKLVGKNVTASLMIGDSVYGASLTVMASGYNDASLASGWYIGVETLTAAGYGYVQFVYVGTGAVTVQAVKLELGSVSTLHLDTPPSPAEQELNRQVCMRYYQRIPTLYAYGYCATTTAAYVTVPVPVPMRITPSIIVDDNGALNFGITTIATTWLTVVASNNNQVHLGVGGSGMTSNAPCVLHDATIALSADL